MAAVSLDGTWRLWGAADPQVPSAEPPAEAIELQARVPGNVELDLLTAGLLEGPLERGNRIYAAQRYERYHWWYQKKFEAPLLAPGERARLLFEGLDCLATVYLNGEVMARSANALVPIAVDVTDGLRSEGANVLTVHLEPAVVRGEAEPLSAHCWAMGTNWESLRIRKAPHCYGWDILPRLVSAGLWRSVRLEMVPSTRFDEVYLWTTGVDAAAGTARLAAQWHLAGGGDGATVRLSLSRAGRPAGQWTQAVLGAHGRLVVDVADAQLWQPRGWGEPALYRAELVLLDADGAVLARHTERIGLRTVELVRTDRTDAAGCGQFLFRVNGQPLYARGTNWVPLDALHSRDSEHLPAALDMLADLNCNMVRCWGGNVYESDAFFDGCDERGILVWQDFAFACASYPSDDAFLAECAVEAEAVVKRLRNHACLALWAGNNENDECLWGGWGGQRLDPNADPLSRRVLAELVRQQDPARPYLPSSPYLGPGLLAGHYPAGKPEDHLWGPRDDFKGAFYLGSNAHFVSEIGYHGCPERASLEAMMDPEYLWPWQDNDQWLTHAVRPKPQATSYNYRIELMAKQIGVLFDGVPDELDDFVLASQASQAEALKFFVELWRLGKPRRTGLLWWNLRDGWPVISDAIVDYYGRRKLAYEVVRRCQADLLLAVAEPVDGRQELVAVNDALAPSRGTVRLTDLDSGAELLAAEFAVPANDRASLGWVAPAVQPAMWRIDWQAGGVSGLNHYLAGPRPFRLTDYRRWLAAMGLGAD